MSLPRPPNLTSIRATGFPDSSVGKEFTCNAGDPSSIPEEGNSSPLQYSGLENSMDCVVHGVAKSQTQLRDLHFQGHDTNRKAKLHIFSSSQCTNN